MFEKLMLIALIVSVAGLPFALLVEHLTTKKEQYGNRKT